jgi:hypothetical protein
MSRLKIRDGYFFATGVLLLVCVLQWGGLILDRIGIGTFYDDSDAPPLRSGLSIKTDYLTMCQYFVTWSGQITPRMSRDGKQVCK